MEGLAIEGTGWGSCYQPRLSAENHQAEGMQKVELKESRQAPLLK